MLLKDFNKLLVVISTMGKNYKKIEYKIEQKLSKILEKDKYMIMLTKDHNSIKELSRDFALNNKNSLIIIVGGDGSISEAVNSIYDIKDIYFSFLPNGTGNDFSKTVYPKMKFDDILENIENIEIKKSDLIKVNNEVSINVCSFGYDSIVLEKSLEIKNKLPFLSNISFILGVIFTLNKIRKYKYDYKLYLENGDIIEDTDEFILTAICNGGYYGDGFNPSPFAKIDDNILEVNSINYIKLLKLVRLIPVYKDKRHLELEESKNYRVKKGYFKRSDNSKFLGNIDGNLCEWNEIEFEILENKLNLVVFKK